MNTPIINPIWFYLMEIAGKLGGIMIGLTVAGVLVSLFVIMAYLCDDESNKDEKIKTLKIAKKTTITTAVIVLAFLLIPSQETMMKMLIAQNVTYERVEGGKEMVKETVDYLFEKIDESQKEEE